jgi:hypothetical protein
LLLDLDESRLSQHPQVPRDTRPSDRERLGELADRRRMGAQYLEHRAPALVRQCVQHRRIAMTLSTDRARA